MSGRTKVDADSAQATDSGVASTNDSIRELAYEAFNRIRAKRRFRNSELYLIRNWLGTYEVGRLQLLIAHLHAESGAAISEIWADFLARREELPRDAEADLGRVRDRAIAQILQLQVDHGEQLQAEATRSVDVD